MSDQEKIDKFGILETLRTRFGGEDKIFASHTLDEGRAKELRKLAENNGISLSEVQDIVAGYLYFSDFYAEHIKEQSKKTTDFFSKN